jgi:hypothetical protein
MGKGWEEIMTVDLDRLEQVEKLFGPIPDYGAPYIEPITVDKKVWDQIRNAFPVLIAEVKELREHVYDVESGEVYLKLKAEVKQLRELYENEIKHATEHDLCVADRDTEIQRLREEVEHFPTLERAYKGRTGEFDGIVVSAGRGLVQSGEVVDHIKTLLTRLRQADALAEAAKDMEYADERGRGVQFDEAVQRLWKALDAYRESK